MRPGKRPPAVVLVLTVLAGLACLGPAAGCGGRKRSPMTMAERLQRARSAATPDLQARELTQVARLQLQAADRSGAAKTVGEARAIYLLLERGPPASRPPAAAENAAEPDAGEPAAAESVAEPAGGEPAPADAGDDAAAAPDAAPPGDSESADAVAEPAPEPAGGEPLPAEVVEREPINAVVWGPLLVDMASIYADLGEQPAARDILAQARKLASEIPDVISQTTLLSRIGGVFGSRTGSDAANARTALKQAVQLADEVEPRFRAEALAAVALGYVKAGLAREAGEMVAALEQSARDVESPRARAEGLAAAANVRALSGDADAAKELLTEAADAAKSIEGAENRTYALMSVATAMSATGAPKPALGLLAEAEKSANRVPDPEAQRTALEKVRALRSDISRKRPSAS